MTRIVRLLTLLVFSLATACAAKPLPARAADATSRVSVVFALQGPREYHVPWHSALTVSGAIDAAAKKAPANWKEAWCYRESFWTRKFPNPHSFWARVLAGEKAKGYTHVANSAPRERSLTLRPGDRIYVDLAPID